MRGAQIRWSASRDMAFRDGGGRVLMFDLGKVDPSGCLSTRSRGSVGERPLHTRKVAGSIPAGTTTNRLVSGGFREGRLGREPQS